MRYKETPAQLRLQTQYAEGIASIRGFVIDGGQEKQSIESPSNLIHQILQFNPSTPIIFWDAPLPNVLVV